MIVSSSLLALSIWKQNATIDFTCRAQTLTGVVKQLGAIGGLNLTVSKECANDVLVISAKRVTFQALMAEIARVDTGEWKAAGSEIKFVANATARHAEARVEQASAAKKVEKNLQVTVAATMKGLVPIVSADGAIGSQNGADEVLSGKAGQLVVLELLKEIDRDALVLGRDQRIVFSSHPNAMQVALGGGFDQVLASFIAKQYAAAERFKASGAIAVPNDPAISRGRQGVSSIPGYAKADLEVSDLGSAGNFAAALTLYNATGVPVYESPQEVVVSEFTGQDDSVATPSTPGDTASSGRKVALSEAAKGFRRIYRSQRTGNSYVVAIPSATLPYLVDIENHDPLGLTPTDELLAYADLKGKPLVAVVPDDAFVDATTDTAGDLSMDEFSKSLADGDLMSIKESNGWLEVKPSMPDSARRFRCDRVVLGQFTRNCLQEAIPTLDQFAEFTLRTPDLSSNSVVQAYLTTAVSGFGNAGLGTINNWNLYRIYAEFPPDLRARLLSGAKLPMRSLTAGQLANLSQMVFGSTQKLQVGIGPGPLAKSFPSSNGLAAEMPNDLKGYESEPTELLPDGIPSDGFYEMSFAEEPFVSPSGPTTEGYVFPRVLGVAQMARKEVNLSQARTPQNAEAILFNKFRMGSRTLYALTLHPSPKAFVTGRLYDFHLDMKSAELSANELPAEWRTEVARRVAALRAAQAERRANEPKTAPPPR